MPRFRGYVFSRFFLSERAPQHVQNIVIREYCRANNFEYLLSATEYSIDDCYVILENLLQSLEEIQGVVFYSLYQLPSDEINRKRIYDKFLSSNKEMHFALENYKITMYEHCEKIENIFEVQNTLDKTLKLNELKKVIVI